jgi:hypothetical protein
MLFTLIFFKKNLHYCGHLKQNIKQMKKLFCLPLFRCAQADTQVDVITKQWR